MKTTAPQILQNSLGHLDARAVHYDAPGGERSMRDTVAMFNTLTKNNLSERDGWQFMELLKMVRSRQGAFKADTYEDGAAYAALAGEAAASEHAAHIECMAALQIATTPQLTLVEKNHVDDATSRKTHRNRAKPTVQKPARTTRARRR